MTRTAPSSTPVSFAALSLFALLASGCAYSAGDSGAAPDGPERAAYLTLFGDDTLAVEWMAFDERSVNAQALVRGSRTTWSEFHLETGPEGSVTAYDARTWAGGSSQGELLSSERLERTDSGPVMVTTRGENESRRAFEAGPCAVPFVDMLHWGFEASMRCQRATQGGIGEAVETFSGRGATFPLARNDDGSWSLTHPTRGPSTMHVDEAGRILDLDGTGSTRAYDLRRMAWDDLAQAAYGAMFADRPLGELSGRGEIDDEVAGVRFWGDYGAPRKRGRDIFPGLLAYGVWWRTGANASTTFGFDHDIVIDGETIPAGEYSLSSIPEENGGTLIINRNTGQGGQSFDASEDQARARMRRDRLDSTVEVFQIRVVPDGQGGGCVELRWDDTVYWVPFTVG